MVEQHGEGGNDLLPKELNAMSAATIDTVDLMAGKAQESIHDVSNLEGTVHGPPKNTVEEASEQAQDLLPEDVRSITVETIRSINQGGMPIHLARILPQCLLNDQMQFLVEEESQQHQETFAEHI